MTAMMNFDMARQMHAQQAGQDLQGNLGRLRQGTLAPADKEKKLKEACEGFESIFIQKMWQEMRKSVHQSSFLHGREEQFWQDMYDQELAKKMTSAGGIGIAEMMYTQLSSHLTSASKSTALAMNQQRAFVPSAAPLVPSEKVEQVNDPLELKMRNNFYEQVGAVESTASEKEPQKEALLQSQQPAEEKKAQGTAQSGNKVDPRIENALASMRNDVERRAFEAPVAGLAQVTYASPLTRKQPVGGEIDMLNAVRRQAGDQLGSRGVREPLLPQTERARAATLNASERKLARKNVRQLSQENVLIPEGGATNVFAPMSLQGAQGSLAQEPVQNAQVQTAALAQNQVQTAALAQNQVQTAALAQNQVQTAALAQNQVQTAARTQNQEQTAARTQNQEQTAARTQNQEQTAARTQNQEQTAARTQNQVQTAARTQNQVPSNEQLSTQAATAQPSLAVNAAHEPAKNAAAAMQPVQEPQVTHIRKVSNIKRQKNGRPSNPESGIRTLNLDRRATTQGQLVNSSLQQQLQVQGSGGSQKVSATQQTVFPVQKSEPLQPQGAQNTPNIMQSAQAESPRQISDTQAQFTIPPLRATDLRS